MANLEAFFAGKALPHEVRNADLNVSVGRQRAGAAVLSGLRTM